MAYAPGDAVPYGAGVIARVDQIEPCQHLVACEAFVLRPLRGDRTRLIFRYRGMGFISATAGAIAPDAALRTRLLHFAIARIPGVELLAQAIDFILSDLLHHYMEAGMLKGIKARAEGKLPAGVT